MIYYRLASQKRHSSEWEWTSPVLSSLEAVFRMRQRCNALPVESLRVFLASSAEYLEVLLVRENLGLSSNSLTMEQLLHDHSSITTSQVRLFEMELGWPENGPQVEAVEAREAVQVTGQEAAQEQHFPLVPVVDHEPGGGDHDTPYTFTFPLLLPQMRAWMRLRERVQAGELLP